MMITPRSSYRPFQRLALFGVLLIISSGAQSHPPSIQIEVMASRTSWSDKEFAGHAFMCISIPLSSGIKEDCFGFYPRDGVKGIIGGPGITNSEFAKNASRFSRVTISMKRPIADEGRRQILRLIDDWNAREYNLTHQSCIDFVNTVAKTLGWRTPPRIQTDLPATFLKKLVDAN